MKMTMQPTRQVWDDDAQTLRTIPNTDHAETQGNCDRCGTLIRRFRGMGTLTCTGCDAHYSPSGQRYRDDLYSRPNRSEWDEDCGDLEGDELSHLERDRYYEGLDQEVR